MDYNRIVNAVGSVLLINGTPYDLHPVDGGRPWRSLEGGALERAALANSIRRVCDADLIHKPEVTTLARRDHGITVEQVAAWYVRTEQA